KIQLDDSCIDQRRTIMFKCTFQCFPDFIFIFHLESFSTECFSKFYEVRILIQKWFRITLFIKLFLPLSDHAQCLVVHDDHFYRQVVMLQRLHFLHGHLEAAVSDDCNYSRISVTKLCAECRRQAEAHCTEAAARYEAVWPVQLVELCCPHLMLPHICCNNRFAVSFFIYLFDQPLRGNQVVTAFVPER